MNSRNAIQFSNSGEITVVDQNRQVIGTAISLLFHVICVYGIITASSALSNFNPPMVIDFSIEQFTGDTTPKKPVAKAKPISKPEEPVIKKIIPKEKPQPEVVARKIEPIDTKKVIAEEKPPEQVVIEQPPVVETVETIPQDTIENDVDTALLDESDEQADDDLEKSSGPDLVQSLAQHKEQYIKEHFLYIKDSVQNQISYPRIARKMGWQGKVLISFVVCVDGSVKNIKIIESSGFKALDKNAVEVIQKVAPFPEPPVSAELIIPIIYKLS